jgi:hypothetical protein
MEKGLLITLPRHDDVTEYFTKFSVYIEEEAVIRGINIKKLKDKEANKKDFEKVLSKLDYNFIVFNGHGSETTIKGYNDKIIIESGVNDLILNDRIVYARSCHAGAILGKDCVKNSKEGCFIGYKVPFRFWVDPLSFYNPLNDNVARFFLEPSNLVPISLIKGNSAKDAHENSKKQILKNIDKIIKSKRDDSLTLAEDLWNNYAGQVLIGNELASI